MPDPESVGNESQEETEAGIDRMYEKTDPMPTVDLERARERFGLALECHITNELRVLAIKLAEEVERLRRDEAIAWGIHFCCNGQDCGCEGLPIDPPLWWTPDIKKLQEENTQMREALEWYEEATTFEFERDNGKIARAALKEKERGPDERD